MARGSGREWGYTSYDIDDEEGKERLTYTSYEKDGSVNRYTDNGDGGHSHSHWNNAEDYNCGKERDWGRDESNGSKNPSEPEGGCFLTSACINYMQNKFDDNCFELSVLRWFRDSYVAREDIEHYYKIAPQIVDKINLEENKEFIYNYIYDNLIVYCINQIINGNYENAYERYKNIVCELEKYYLEKQLVKKYER